MAQIAPTTSELAAKPVEEPLARAITCSRRAVSVPPAHQLRCSNSTNPQDLSRGSSKRLRGAQTTLLLEGMRAGDKA